MKNDDICFLNWILRVHSSDIPGKIKKIYLPKIYEMIYLKYTERPFYIDLDFSMEQRFCLTVLYEYTIKTTCILFQTQLLIDVGTQMSEDATLTSGSFWTSYVKKKSNAHCLLIRQTMARTHLLGNANTEIWRGELGD